MLKFKYLNCDFEKLKDTENAWVQNRENVGSPSVKEACRY